MPLKKTTSFSEEEFTQSSPGPKGSSTSIALLVFISFICATLFLYNWGLSYLEQYRTQHPFLKVTNRQFSVFLWQFPVFLRIHSKTKTGYLSAFEAGEERLRIAEAEKTVSAPPELLLLYHTWHRLLLKEFTSRPIPPPLFKEFLNQVEIWQPSIWLEAPLEYKKLVADLDYLHLKDLSSLSEKELPLMVKISFQGWRNYFKEGAAINLLRPTVGEVRGFLKKHGNYSRSYWKNFSVVFTKEVAGKNYLIDLSKDKEEKELATNQLSSFLKVALFNAQQASLEQ